MKSFRNHVLLGTVILTGSILAVAQDTAFRLDPAPTSVKFTLGDVLHTVHGTFKLKDGSMETGSQGKISGEIVVDARSGASGNDMRDRKMHKEVLESARYPEIAFHPDRISGEVPRDGKASLMVHGLFNIHGVDREITVPVEIDLSADHWTAIVHFSIPYAKWGMKNPSTLFLRVSDTVEIDLAAAGSVVRNSASVNQ